MLVAEYDYDTDIAVQRQESLMIGIQQGIAQGIQQGIQQGFSDGAYQKAIEIARNLFRLGLSIENIAEATGLAKEEIESI